MSKKKLKSKIIVDPRGQWAHPGKQTRIPGNDITMQGVPYPVWAQPNVGPGAMMQPGQDYKFPGADYVDETPMAKKGGQSPKVRIPTNPKGIKSKAYSRSLEATNKLFALNPLFEVPKSRKRKIFDPNASFYADGGIVSFDYDDTLTTNAGMQMAKNTPSDEKYIISARAEVTPDMIARARDAGIPEDRIFAMGSDEAKVAKVRELGIDRHIDNKQSVVDQLGYLGQQFQDGGQSSSDEYVELELSPEEIQAYRDGGYIVEEAPEYKEGGALLTKKVTCKKCGWKWDAADGGDDITTCHKCGGQGLVHAQKGGESSFYTVPGSEGVYKKVNGNWQVDWNKSGKFQPLSKGDVAKRTAVLNKQAKPLFDADYSDLASSREYKAAPKAVVQKAPTTEQKKAQASFNKDFKVTDKSKFEKVQDKIKTDQEKLVAWGKENNVAIGKEDLDRVDKAGWNMYGQVGNQGPDPGTVKQVTPEEAQGFWDKAADIASNPMTSAGFLIRGQAIPDYMQRDMDRGTFGYYANGQLHTERNPLDFALADMTGLGMINDARSVYKGVKDKDVSEAGLGLLGFIPGVGEVRKAANTADAARDVAKAVEFTGPMKHSYSDTPDALNALRQRGRYWDEAGAKGEDVLHPDMVNYHGTYSGRPIVEVKMPDGSSEMFYKSTGWAGKAGSGADNTTSGMWQVFGGHSDTPQTSNWFIKDKDYQNYYGSNTFRGMAENMDKALMQKHGFQSINEVDDALNFQNRFGDVDTYTPKRKGGGESPSLPLKEGRTAYKRWAYGVNDKMAMQEDGGFIELELDDAEIEEYRKGGYVVEEIKFQDGGITTVPTIEQSQPPVMAPMLAPNIMPTGDLVAPPVVTQPVVDASVQQPSALVTTPVINQPAPTKKEVEKVAMPKIEQSGDVKAIQKKLVAAGYNIGASGPSRDGVDGVMGNKTQMALDAFNSGIPPSKLKTIEPKKQSQSTKYVVNKNIGTGYLPYLDRGKGEEVCVKGKGCSFNVSVKMGNLLGGLADGDIWANDAWFNKSDVLNKGGDLIYETTERDMTKMPKVPKDVYAKLQVGDYVQLNRVNTKTSGEFASETKGNLQNENVEHLGFVVGKDKDGTPLIWHGSEKGKAFIKRLDEPITLDDHDKSVFNYQVASIVRSPSLKNADMSGLQNTAYYSTIDPKQKLVPGKTATERQRQAANVINNNVRNIKNLGYSQEDANFVGQILVGGIMQNETQGGESIKRIPKQIAATVWKDVLGQGEFEGDEASIGYYQMKPTLNFVNKDGSLNPLGKKLEKLGVDPKDIGTFDIDAQTKAGTVILLDNYEKLKKDPDFNIKSGLYKGKIPASYILAKSWQAGVDWQNKEKYKKFLNNLNVDYSDNALKSAVNTMSIAGSKRTVNSDYAIIKAHNDKIKAKKAAADKKILEEKLRKQRLMQSSINQGRQNSRKIGYAESTAVRGLSNYPKGMPDLRKLDLTKKSLAKKPAAKKPATKTFWDQTMDKINLAAKASVKKPIAKKPATKPLTLAQNLKNLNNPFYNKVSLFSKGGIVTELSQKEIDAYKKAGYTIEELD